MRLQEPDYQSKTGYQEYEYPDTILREFLNKVRQGQAWRTRPVLIQQMVNDLDAALARCRQDGRAQKIIPVRVPSPVAVPTTLAGGIVEPNATPVLTVAAPADAHVCPDCGKAYKMAMHLANHRKTHALAGV